MKKICVILSGCGVFDGTEIQEAVLTLLYLDRAGVEVSCYAPDIFQQDVVDHITMEAVAEERRNVLVESARIVRGQVKSLLDLNIDDFDALVMPGGVGTEKNLCAPTDDGAGRAIDPEVARVIREAHASGKVIGAMCNTPLLVAQALRDTDSNPTLTVGTDEQVIAALAAFNAQPLQAEANEVVVDQKNRIVSTPAFMLAEDISQLSYGIKKLVTEVLEMA